VQVPGPTEHTQGLEAVDAELLLSTPPKKFLTRGLIDIFWRP
jgi:hypothetical protein